MSGKVFVDTNVLVYAHDSDAAGKRTVASRLLRELWENRRGVVSPQVLQEFYVSVTRKISKPVLKDKARTLVRTYSVWCSVTTTSDIERAFEIEESARIGFWDALVVASAARAGAEYLLTEDLNHGQSIAGVRIENPFKAASQKGKS